MSSRSRRVRSQSVAQLIRGLCRLTWRSFGRDCLCLSSCERTFKCGPDAAPQSRVTSLLEKYCPIRLGSDIQPLANDFETRRRGMSVLLGQAFRGSTRPVLVKD